MLIVRNDNENKDTVSGYDTMILSSEFDVVQGKIIL